VTSGKGAGLGAEAALRLARTGRCRLDPGLTEAEIIRVERDHGFEFADDHRAFLQAALPLSEPAERDAAGQDRAGRDPWPDWRGGDPAELRERLSWPADGTLFDVEHNAFWYPAWGPRPAGLDRALAAARRHLAHVPAMVPVYSHRYLPAGRGSYGHPVLSIHQTDIIVYGADLADYVTRELGDAGRPVDASRLPPALVPFWGDLLG
jgi:hypothetical protein